MKLLILFLLLLAYSYSILVSSNGGQNDITLEANIKKIFVPNSEEDIDKLKLVYAFFTSPLERRVTDLFVFNRNYPLITRRALLTQELGNIYKELSPSENIDYIYEMPWMEGVDALWQKIFNML